MVVLAIDTSTSMGSMGFYEIHKDQWTLLADKNWVGSHSEVITEILMELLSQAQLKLKQLERIYVGIGPGSFTGLRVSINLVRTISYSFSIPVGAVNSLALLAWPHAHRHGQENKTLSLMKAQKNIVYAGAYASIQKNFKELLAPTSMGDTELLGYIESHFIAPPADPMVVPLTSSTPLVSSVPSASSDPTPPILCGWIHDELKEKIAQKHSLQILTSTPRSSHLVEYYLLGPHKFKPMAWREIVPLYIRASAAEEIQKEKQKMK